MRVDDRGLIRASGKETEPREKEGELASGSDVLSYRVQPNRWRMVLYAAAVFSLLAALIHLRVMPEHFEEWWGYGAFFLVSATAQGLYSAVLLRRPRRPLLLLGIGGNLAIIALYLLTRTVGIPFFGPHAGEVEGIGALDLSAAAAELALTGTLVALLLKGLPRERVVVVLFVLGMAVLLVAHLLHLILSASATH